MSTILKVLWDITKKWGLWAALAGYLAISLYGVYKRECGIVSDLRTKVETLTKQKRDLQDSLASCEFNSRIRSKYESVLEFNPFVGEEPKLLDEKNQTVFYKY